MSALCLKLLVFHIIPLLTFCFNKFFYFALIFSKMTTHPLKSSHFKQEFPFFFVLFYLMFRKVRKKSRQNETLPGRIAPACLSSLRDSYFMLQSFYLDQYNITRYSSHLLLSEAERYRFPRTLFSAFGRIPGDSGCIRRYYPLSAGFRNFPGCLFRT